MLTLYDTTHKPAILEKKDMPGELEALAVRLVKSGRLRIDADERANFVRLNLKDLGLDFTFSNRELNSRDNYAKTKEFLLNLLRYKYAEEEANTKFERYMLDMRGRLARKGRISFEMEMKLARLVAQCNHPAVIKLLIKENAEIFLSFSHNIGDMLNMESWQRNGRNSGMQAAGRAMNSVFISLGGDPFILEKDTTYAGDGKAAIARLLIIGGQETGHFADMIRDKSGRPISRHSADIHGLRAKPHVKKARHEDKKLLAQHFSSIKKMGLANAVEIERQLKFFREKRKFSFIRAITELKSRLLYRKLKSNALQRKLNYIADLQKSALPSTLLSNMYRDMQFNIEPKADVYKKDNPDEEEAIACIEALARVPQQVNKWGHKTVAALWPGLYKIYYKEVIPEVERTLTSR